MWEDLAAWAGGRGRNRAPKMAAAPPRRRTARGEGRGGGGGLLSRGGRLLRSPSSLALTEGPAAPWGGLRTAVGDGGPSGRGKEGPSGRAGSPWARGAVRALAREGAPRLAPRGTCFFR